MAIVVEGELRSSRRDLFCVFVGLSLHARCLIALGFLR